MPEQQHSVANRLERFAKRLQNAAEGVLLGECQIKKVEWKIENIERTSGHIFPPSLPRAKVRAMGRSDQGVLRADGSLPDLGKCASAYFQTDNELLKQQMGRPSVVFDRPVVFLGCFHPHVGHGFLESLGRLWAVEELQKNYGDDLCGVYLKSQPPTSPVEAFVDGVMRQLNPIKEAHVLTLSKFLGVDIETFVTFVPIFAETLIIPEDQFGQAHGGGAKVEYVSWFRQKVDQAISAEGVEDLGLGEKIYVSRSRVSKNDVLILCEEQVEKNMRRQGYSVFHPQEHDFATQAKVYRGASHIVAFEGTALHFAAAFSKPDVRMACVIRRKNGVFPYLANNIAAFDITDVTWVQATTRFFLPQNVGNPRRKARIACDIGVIGSALLEAGFIASLAEWVVPSQADIEADICKLALEGVQYS